MEGTLKCGILHFPSSGTANGPQTPSPEQNDEPDEIAKATQCCATNDAPTTEQNL